MITARATTIATAMTAAGEAATAAVTRAPATSSPLSRRNRGWALEGVPIRLCRPGCCCPATSWS
jgi:hypothetical protein